MHSFVLHLHTAVLLPCLELLGKHYTVLAMFDEFIAEEVVGCLSVTKIDRVHTFWPIKADRRCAGHHFHKTYIVQGIETMSDQWLTTRQPH